MKTNDIYPDRWIYINKHTLTTHTNTLMDKIIVGIIDDKIVGIIDDEIIGPSKN